MKKKIVVLIVLVILTSLGIIIILNNKNKSYEITDDNHGQFAFYYQGDTGEYTRSNEVKWSTGEYVLNLANSTCDGEQNPAFLSWNNYNRSVVLTRNKATKCSLYFDKKLPTIFDKCPGVTNLVECITQIDGKETGEENLTSDLCPDGIGTVYKHDGTNPNDAGDGGYRYSGCNPNNYICFGNGSEPYNRGETDICPVENKYRVIGIVPVKVGDTTKNLVKVIKAEYLTAEELGINSDGVPHQNNLYTNLKRVENLPNDGFILEPDFNSWGENKLNNALNGTYLNVTLGEFWENKIENVRWNWNIGDWDLQNANASYMHEKETDLNDNLINSKIGLMYVHDYGFASSQDDWNKSVNFYGENSRKNNWLFNGVSEWTISENFSNKIDYFIDCYYDGHIGTYVINLGIFGVRPTFYLTSDTNIVGDETSNGAVDHPFKTEIPSKQLETLLNTPVGDGVLLRHTKSLENSAKDNGYRYSGNQPNNYICFGKGSESYNQGEQDNCPLENKYRIIGYVPVIIDKKQKFRLKVIKAEYLTDEKFKKRDDTASFSTSFTKIQRIESSIDNIAGYIWNSSNINKWKDSTLEKSLNSENYINEAFGETWQNKIEKVTWNVEGADSANLTAKEFYENEMVTQLANERVERFIGLMYAHDYGFASTPNNWQYLLYEYNNKNEGCNNRQNNWLFNGVYEWNISRRTDVTNTSFIVDFMGQSSSYYVNLGKCAVRPVFYLKENVTLVSDENYNGTKEKPIKVEV